MFSLLELPQEVLDAVVALVEGRQDRRALRLASPRTRAVVDAAVSAVVHPKPPGAPPGGAHYAVELPAPVPVLCAAPWSLHRLVLTHLKLTLGDVSALAAQTRSAWPLLEELSLENCSVGDAGVRALRTGSWACLKHLNLNGDGLPSLGDAAAADLAGAALPNLESLELRGAALTAQGAAHLARVAWPKLQRLDLTHSELSVQAPSARVLGAEGAAALSRGAWPDLRHLELNLQMLGDAGLAALATAAWPKLQRLDIHRNYFGDAGAARLVAWPDLEELDIGYSSLTDAGVAALVGAGRPKLRKLGLSGNDLRAPALGRLNALEELDVSEMGLGAEGGAALAAAGLPKLRTLHISLVGPGLVEELVKAKWESLALVRVLRSWMGDRNVYEGYCALQRRWPLGVEYVPEIEDGEESSDPDADDDVYVREGCIMSRGYGMYGGGGEMYGCPSTSSSDDY